MRRTIAQPFASRSWTITLLIGFVFLGLEYGLRCGIREANVPHTDSWLDLALFLSAYVFVFCLKPIQIAVQRKLCLRATHSARQKTSR